jgi:hypothetical protein
VRYPGHRGRFEYLLAVFISVTAWLLAFSLDEVLDGRTQIQIAVGGYTLAIVIGSLLWL